MVHTFLAGLITFAVMLPFNLVLVEAFTQSNEPDYPDGQLSWPLLYRILFGQQTWHFQVRLAGSHGLRPNLEEHCY